MVKDLIAGRRQGTLLQALTLAVVVLLGLVVVGIAIASMHSASVASATARLVQARYVTSQNQVFHLCVQREDIEKHLREVESKDVALQQAMIRIESTNKFVDATVREERLAAFATKLNADVAYLVTPIEDGCEKLKP